MKDELKNLRSVFHQTIFQENHFTEANRQIVMVRIKDGEKRYRNKNRLYIRTFKPVFLAIGTGALCVLLFVAFQNIFLKQNLLDHEGNFVQSEIPDESSEHGAKMATVNSNLDLPESVIEQVASQLNKSDKDISPEDLSRVTYLEINEPFEYASVLSQFDNLEELAVYIPVEDWSFLQEVPELHSLHIANNELKDLTFLPESLPLTYLAVENNKLQQLEGIQRFPGIRTLSIIQNEITDLEPLWSLPGLTVLYARDNKITTLDQLKDLTTIEILDIGTNPIRDFSALAHFSNLQILSMSDTGLETLEVLKDLHELLRLDIRGTAVSDLSPLADKKKLYFLDIRDTEVASIEPLLGMDNLRFVLLDKDRVADWTLLEDQEHVVEVSEDDIIAQ